MTFDFLFQHLCTWNFLIRQPQRYSLAVWPPSHIFKLGLFQMWRSMVPKAFCLPWSQTTHRLLGSKALKQVGKLARWTQPHYSTLQLEKEREKQNESKRETKDRPTSLHYPLRYCRRSRATICMKETILNFGKRLLDFWASPAAL